jgi:hypothetical protein
LALIPEHPPIDSENASAQTAASAAKPLASELPPVSSSSCSRQGPFYSEEEDPQWLDEVALEILRATRGWLQYGLVGFAVMCIVIGAIEALFGR